MSHTNQYPYVKYETEVLEPQVIVRQKTIPTRRYSIIGSIFLLLLAMLIDTWQAIPTDVLITADLVSLPFDILAPEVDFPIEAIITLLAAVNTILSGIVQFAFLMYIGIPGKYAFAGTVVDSVPGVNIVPYCTIGVLYKRFYQYHFKMN
jgi:hypothetical protein